HRHARRAPRPPLTYVEADLQVRLRKQLLLDQLDQQVHDLDVHLLDAIGRGARHDDDVIARTPQRPPVAPEQADDAQATRPRSLYRRNQVGTLARRREHDQRVAGLAPRFDAAGEHAIEAVVVGDAR